MSLARVLCPRRWRLFLRLWGLPVFAIANTFNRFDEDYILEIESLKDLQILLQIFDGCVLLGTSADAGWDIKYSTEYHMTQAAKKGIAIPFEHIKDYNFTNQDFGYWKTDVEEYICFYSGNMIHQFDFSYKKWISGSGNTATWQILNQNEKCWRPEFVMPNSKFGLNSRIPDWNETKLVFRDFARSTDARTMIAAIIPAWPCGNKVPILCQDEQMPVHHKLLLCAVLNSFVYDYVVRMRLTGFNLNKFIVDETPIPPLKSIPERLAILVAQIAMPHEVFAASWLELAEIFPELGEKPWRSWWATDLGERQRVRAIIEAVIAQTYGLSRENLLEILNPDPSRAKGFFRVDQELPEPARLTTLTLEAWDALEKDEINLTSEGSLIVNWQLPESTRQFYPQSPSVEGVDATVEWRNCFEISERLKLLRTSVFPEQTIQGNVRQSKKIETNTSLFGETVA